MRPSSAARVGLLFLLVALPAAAAERQAPEGLSLQPHVQWISGWQVSSKGERIQASSGAGLGLRLGYDFSRYVGLFGSAELDVEDEGPYSGYGGGAALHSGLLGPVRLNLLVGGRVLTLSRTIVYGTAGLGAELFVSTRLSLRLEGDAAFALSNDNGYDGPKRLLFGLAWHPFS